MDIHGQEMKIDLQQQLQTAFALHRQGAIEDAAKLYREVFNSDPDNFDAANLLAITSLQLGKYEEAAELFVRAINLNPTFADTYSNRGIALAELKRLDQAVASYDKAIALKPDHADAYSNRGNALKELGRFDEAITSYETAIALKPDHADAYSNRGDALNELKRFNDAIASCDRAIRSKPHFAQAYYNRGNALNALKRLDEAVVNYDRAIALRPDYAEAYSNRGNALCELRLFGDAAASYERAIALKPDYAEAYSNRGNALNELMRFEEAIASYEKAIALKPDYAQAYANKSVARLLAGDFKAGWQDYEWRKTIDDSVANRSFSAPLWLGADSLKGKTLFIHWEQGLGDTLQFCRYARLARARAARVVLSAPDRLVRLLKPLEPEVEIVGAEETPAHFDYHCPLMSLPLAFATTLATIPHEVPYLSADPNRVQQWRSRLGDGGFKVGVCWQGSTGKADSGRSFGVAQFVELSQIDRVRLISLHKGAGERQLGGLPEGLAIEIPGPDFDAGPDAFLDTAAIIKCCDLIITSDTAVAHLAGALGAPVWIALKSVPDWRWMLGRSDSPWYPTMKLFRQSSRDDWRSVFGAMAVELRSLVN